MPRVVRGAADTRKLKIALVGCGGRSTGALVQAMGADSNNLQPPSRPVSHTFCEKPMATDAPGVRSVLESARLAKEKNLSIVAGFNARYDQTHREFMKEIHEGKLGEIISLRDNRLGGQVKPMPPRESRPDGMGDVEWQLRNWCNFYWLSGDGLVEQAVHHVDRMMWVMNDVPPIDCIANGGRNTPNHEGNIYDQIDALWQRENGVQGSLLQRQIPGSESPRKWR